MTKLGLSESEELLKTMNESKDLFIAFREFLEEKDQNQAIILQVKITAFEQNIQTLEKLLDSIKTKSDGIENSNDDEVQLAVSFFKNVKLITPCTSSLEQMVQTNEHYPSFLALMALGSKTAASDTNEPSAPSIAAEDDEDTTSPAPIVPAEKEYAAPIDTTATEAVEVAAAASGTIGGTSPEDETLAEPAAASGTVENGIHSEDDATAEPTETTGLGITDNSVTEPADADFTLPSPPTVTEPPSQTFAGSLDLAEEISWLDKVEVSFTW